MSEETSNHKPEQTPELDASTIERGHNLPKAVANAVGSYGNQAGAKKPDQHKP